MIESSQKAMFSVVSLILLGLIISSHGLAAGFSNKQQTNAKGFGSKLSKMKTASYTPDSSSEVKDFVKFLWDEECEGLEVTEIGTIKGLRGIFAKEKIAKDEYICAIPFVSTLLINETLEPVEEQNTLSSDRPENVLAFLEMVENEERWGPYLSCLPMTSDDPNFDPTPDFWTEDEIRQLQVPKLVENMLYRKKNLRTLASEHQIDVDKLQHAAWLVRTRGFTTIKKVQDLVLTRTVLIPYIDMLNHDYNPNAKMEVVETNEYDESFYALQATRDIAPGQQIFISYGTGKENCINFFDKYGFFPEKNPNDKELDLNTEWTSTLTEDREMFKEANGTLKSILSLRIHLKRLQERSAKR